MNCIYCNYEIEEGKPGHEFWYDETLGKIVNAHEECHENALNEVLQK